MQRVLGNDEAALLGDLVLAFFDLGVVELLDPSALHAHQMIVMAAGVEFEHGAAGLEMMSLQQAGVFELGQHPVHRGQAGIQSVCHQQFVHVLGRQVPDFAGFEQIENLQPGRCRLEADGFEIFRFAHALTDEGCGWVMI